MEQYWNGKILGLFGALIILTGAVWRGIKDIITTLIAGMNLGHVGKNVKILSGFVYRYPGNISIGDNVIISRNVSLTSENSNSKLIIGDNVIITIGTTIDFSGNVIIGKNTLLSKNTIIETHDHGKNPYSEPHFRNLEIGDNVWIGMNSIVLSNVGKIGANSIIAAGSIVTKAVPENSLAAGVPARVVKQI
jgi:acetyltransferase-like isoleucine patch superfamily enzyme